MASAKESAMSERDLRELGVEPGEAPTEMVAKLQSLLTSRRGNEIAIAHALGELPVSEAAVVLAQIGSGASGPLRREIRRSLFRLRQRGIEPPAVERRSSPAGEASEIGLSGLLSVADPDGARIAWLMKSRSGGGLNRLWAIASETEGLVGATAETISRKEFRAERAEIERRAGSRLIEADWRLVDFILCEAYRRTPEARRSQVANFLTLRAEMIATAPPADFHHPVYDEFAAQAAGEPSPELMKEPDIAAFRLRETSIKPFADEVASLQQSVIVLNRMQQEDRLNAVVERAIDELLKGEFGDRLRRRLEDTAYCFARTGKTIQAGWAVAAAAKLRDYTELKRIPFFQLFMRAQLGAVLAQQQEKQQEEPRLIMTPAEAMRAAQTRAQQRRSF
jgi:hypothetical protein